MNYKQIKKTYQEQKSVFCPILQERVNFNSKGLRHLFYKNTTRKRVESEVVLRANYIKISREIIGIRTTLQELDEINGSKMYGFISIINLDNKDSRIKIKVIIKKDGSGDWHFFSVIPKFSTSPKRDFKI